jgi:hypothetical protein
MRMPDILGITAEGLTAALDIKERYRSGQPICVPGDGDILIPEHLLNHGLDLRDLEDPMALAMVAARDPEAPMAMAAAARLSPLVRGVRLVEGMYEIIQETTLHREVRSCMDLVREHAFSPDAIAHVRRQASQVIIRTRREYTIALRENLKSLMDGSVAPRQFVQEFFQLTEAGNLRHDIRKKLVTSLMLSEAIRPSIKFLILENFHRLPLPVRAAIVSRVLDAEPSHHIELIKEELRWMVARSPGEVQV